MAFALHTSRDISGSIVIFITSVFFHLFFFLEGGGKVNSKSSVVLERD